MIYKNIEFHNVAELEPMEGFPGLRLQRFPRAVRDKLGSVQHFRGRFVSQKTPGCELRFVTEGKVVNVSLSALEADGEVLVYKGNFFYARYKLCAGVVTTFQLEEPAHFAEVETEALNGYSFSEKVWRIFFNNGYSAVFNSIDSLGYALRPPKTSELPKLKWLAYGSSITQGSAALTHNNSYINQAAVRLGVDVLNCGLSGACLCEKEAADFLAERTDWDFATLELGVNMKGRFTSEEFEERAAYLIKTIVQKNPDKPVAVITIYPNLHDHFIKAADKAAVRNREFNEILRKIVTGLNSTNLYLFEGSDILTSFAGLSCDLVHPSDFGHIIMGENLSKKLKEIPALKGSTLD